MKWILVVALLVIMWGIYGGLQKNEDEEFADICMILLSVILIVGGAICK